jgi:hypothetical protein
VLVQLGCTNPVHRSHPGGVVSGHCEMILGLLCKAKKRRVEAVSHLTEAKRLLGQLGSTPALDRIEQALREVRKVKG